MKKPRIYWTYYPKSKRGYWRVSEFPHKGWYDDQMSLLWRLAHNYTMNLNKAIGFKIEAGRLAKKEQKT